MESLEFSLSKEPPNGSYDEEADVLYISLGAPKPALGVDVGDGIIVRYDEETNEIVGVTLIGLRGKTSRELASPMPVDFSKNGRTLEAIQE